VLTVSVVVSVAAYTVLYLGSPGRQSRAVLPRIPARVVGFGGLAAGLSLSAFATGSAIGPVVATTAVVAVASTLVLIGPFLLPPAGTRR